jgi:hypothetical protein
VISFVKKHAGKIGLFAGGVALGLVLATTVAGSAAVGAVARARASVGV